MALKKDLSTHVCNATDMLLPRLQSDGAVKEARITTGSSTAFALETGEVVWVAEQKKLHESKEKKLHVSNPSMSHFFCTCFEHLLLLFPNVLRASSFIVSARASSIFSTPSARASSIFATSEGQTIASKRAIQPQEERCCVDVDVLL